MKNYSMKRFYHNLYIASGKFLEVHRSYIFSYDWPKKVFCIYLTFLYIIMHFLAQWPLWLVLATNRLKIWAVTHRGLKYHPMASNSDTRTSCLLTHVYTNQN